MNGLTAPRRLSKQPLVAAITIALLASQAATAASFNARNAAMGGTGVASSTYDAAAGFNAALLTRFAENDDFALVLPAFAAEGSDEYEVIDNLDDIVDLYDELEAHVDSNNVSGALASKDAILDKLEDIDQQPVRADVGALIGFAKPSKTFAFAIEARAQLDIFGYADYDPNDEVIIDLAILSGNSSLLDNIQSSALIFGAAITEVAFAFATEFDLGGMPLAVGVTPKYQNVETIVYTATVDDFDEDDFDADEYTEDDSNLNLDVGLALSLSDSLTLGLNLSNLIEEDYDTIYDDLQYTIEPQATAGVAWRGDIITLAFDADLTERQPFDELDGSQFVRAGIEFDVLNWLQLRAGARHDLEDSREDLWTAGIGLSPFNTFHLDLTAATGDKDTYGFAADLRWTF